MMYLKTEEAIKAIQDGENFSQERFQLFRDDREVGLAAVRQDGWALKFTTWAIRNDAEVVMNAVMQDGTSLRFAADPLKSDKGFIIEVVKAQGGALEFATANLQDDVSSGCKLIHSSD